MAGRVFRVGERKPFAGHPTSNPPPLAVMVESPQNKPATIQPAQRERSQVAAFQPQLFARASKPRHKRKSKIKLDRNPPAIGAGVVAFFDGAYERRRATFGAVVYRDGQQIHETAGIVPAGPDMSCNVAEYAGAIHVLRYLQTEGIRQATIYGDSLLVIKQLQGGWRAKAGAYLPFYREAIELRRALPDVRLAWTPREHNAEADELSKRHQGKRSPITYENKSSQHPTFNLV